MTTDRTFPRLSAAQLERLAGIGQRRTCAEGEIVVDQGEVAPGFFVVVSGALAIVQPTERGEQPLGMLREGQFTGEVSLITGRSTLVRIRVAKPGELLVITPEALRKIVQLDPDLSEVLMRAFILRRVGLIAAGAGDAVLVGSTHSAATLRIREFLGRNAQPYAYVDVDQDPDVQALLDRFHLSVGDVPILICRSQRVLKNPSNLEIAQCLGLNPAFDPALVRDVVIVGAGPAGLAAAVYGASEGLDVLVLEISAPGGQAGASTRIENYLGFPTGISGHELAGRAYAQAEKFGAEIVVARAAAALRCERRPYAVELSDGATLHARTVVIATGVQYRKPDSPALARFEGAGVYYAATAMEAELCRGEDAVVIGGGNSAGQAAVFLAQRVRSVRILVRGRGLADTMSRYLVSRLEQTANVSVQPFQQVVGAGGGDHLETLEVRDLRAGERRSLAIRHVFVMTGADPNTAWLQGCVALDEKGFVKTGEAVDRSSWPLPRAPWILETSAPGVFAVGDVRSGSMKRVAAAVGEGSTAIQLVHRALAE
ncbi:MAG TPA: FAD-dependent oxidoreductase [Myxococcales bacterium]|jgi:thioredoxin reductase (NADPH)|nr:FAD-dependent oxidoreductase [Myxococcales bacterium]